MGYGIKSIGVRNFRSLKNLSPIEIKPITLLVGKNSCGKSSFLRLFPFLKQSVEKNIDGPFAFFGEYVDFGDFDTVLNRLESGKSIGFTINGYISRDNFLFLDSKEKKSVQYKVNLEFTKRKDGSVFASNVDIVFGEDISVEIGSRNVLAPASVVIFRFDRRVDKTLFPVTFSSSGLSTYPNDLNIHFLLNLFFRVKLLLNFLFVFVFFYFINNHLSHLLCNYFLSFKRCTLKHRNSNFYRFVDIIPAVVITRIQIIFNCRDNIIYI